MMTSSCSSDLRDETTRPTAFLREHKFLFASYHAGMNVLDGQLNHHSKRSVASTMLRLFGDSSGVLQTEEAKERDVFPAMLALKDPTDGFLNVTDEQITVAIKADVLALFVRVRDVAKEAIPTLGEFVFDNPNLSKRRKHIMDEDTKSCTDFFDRYSVARKEMEELMQVCDNILWFTQIDNVHKLSSPAAVGV
jgi:3',5'-cyclic AMP phosphodiesterase CpdA